MDERTFKRKIAYSIETIKAKSLEVDEPKDYDGVIFLVARARDREYWFTGKDNGWIVDHTWSSFQLVQKEDDWIVE